MALCQFLPGPASSQTGIGLGVARAGLPGGFAAWLGFTLPSAGGLVGWLAPKVPDSTRQAQPFRVSKRLGGVLLTVFAVLLVGVPLVQVTGSFGVAVFGAFYRAGSLVFGGGHVVLPLLQAEAVPPPVGSPTRPLPPGTGRRRRAVPGPLFTFSAFLGAVMQPGLAGMGTALLALVGIFTRRFCCCSG